MSEDFIGILTPTRDYIAKIQHERACGIHEAKRIAREDMIDMAIRDARDIEDVKAVLLALLKG